MSSSRPSDPPSLQCVQVGLACCAVEAATACAREGARAASTSGAEGGDASPVLVVAGTVTDAMVPLIRARYDGLRAEHGAGEVKVVAFGACATSGGPYWDSYAVTMGIDQVLPVDLCVPGCPPRPEALDDALELLNTAGTAGEDR